MADAPALARTLALSDRIGKLRMLDAGQFERGDPFVLHGLDARALACFDKLHSEEP